MPQNPEYPSAPLHVPITIPEPSLDFKKQAKKVLASIILFFILYLTMMVLAVMFVTACIYIGFLIIASMLNLFIIILGIGVIGLGIMVFIFLIKFLFAVSKTDQSGNIEITEHEQAELFNFIKQLTIDTQTQFPGKIFLSP